MFCIAIELFSVEAWSTCEFMLHCFIAIVIDLTTQEDDETFSMISVWKDGCF
jgi:hypothetical protein